MKGPVERGSHQLGHAGIEIANSLIVRACVDDPRNQRAGRSGDRATGLEHDRQGGAPHFVDSA